MEKSLQLLGYNGSRSTLNAFVAQIRKEFKVNKVTTTVSRSHILKCTWNESNAKKLEENVSQVFLEEFPDLRPLHLMVQDFSAIIREKKASSHLIDWLKTYKDISFSAM
ncbi:hypothetical protein [Bacillus sp. S10(2024)]|uniref:hypothetical protein n=1 Tax=Bacillus sp. S10(2024) TaxID=3162886 RepID=UPI003D1B402D